MGEYKRWMGASTLTSDHVVDTKGEDLGKIKEFMLDTVNGCVAYAVLSFGGALGMGDKLFGIPWQALSLDEEQHRFVLDISREQLEQAPGFDKDDWPNITTREFAEMPSRFYGFDGEPMMGESYRAEAAGFGTKPLGTETPYDRERARFAERETAETWTPPQGHEGESWEYHRDNCLAA